MSNLLTMCCCSWRKRFAKLAAGKEGETMVVTADKQGGTAAQALMCWTDLWPGSIQMSPSGWTEELHPGVNVLIDETGDDATPWLTVLTGHALPGRGQVQCAGLCSQANSAAYQAQVYWHNPRLPQADDQITAQQWLESTVQRWPDWSHEAWAAHCEGFALQPHMDKPLWHLSSGSLRKLGIAAALASGALLTVIEEPVAALDSNSIRYLSQALDALGEALAATPVAPRCVIVAHWEPLPGVTWDEVLAPPALVRA